MTTAASERGRLYIRDGNSNGRPRCFGNSACDIDGMLSVSINEGPLGSPDILTTLPARAIKEMRYLLPIDATARFGIVAGNGPVLIVYMK